MHRFFVCHHCFQNDRVVITGAQAHQIKNVLHVKKGNRIAVLDNAGLEYQVEILDIASGKVEGKVLGGAECRNESSVRIVLHQALLKGAKFDFVLQKCTELGVLAFAPFISERCVAESPGDAKHSRWHQIVTEAAEQSGRCRIPEILPVRNFGDAVRSVSGLSLMPWEGESGDGIKSVLKRNSGFRQVNIFIGPEGGFALQEAELARSHGIETVSLGKRILRAETAGLVAAAAVFYETGELGEANF